MSPGLNRDVIVSPSEFCDALEKIRDVTVIHRGRKPDIRIESGMATNIELWELVDHSRFTPRNIDWNNKVIQFRPGCHPDDPLQYAWYDHGDDTILQFNDGCLFDTHHRAISVFADSPYEPTASLSLITISLLDHEATLSIDDLTTPDDHA